MPKYQIIEERKSKGGTEYRVKCRDCPRLMWKMQRNLQRWGGRCRQCTIKLMRRGRGVKLMPIND